MKTSLKFFAFVAIASISFFFGSCETEIPNTDGIPPTFSIRITGDGFDRTFDQDTDFNSFQLNLKRGKLYGITLTGSDAGGLQLLQWFTGGSSYFRPESAIRTPWTYRTGLQSVVQWQGNRGAPLTGAIFEGNFRALGDNISTTFRFYLSDFGGRSGPANITSKEMNVYFSDRPTGISVL